jgi:hypothetical protein
MRLRTKDGKVTESPVESFVSSIAKTAKPVSLVAFCRYRPRRSWQPRVLSAAEGAMDLLRHTVPIRKQPEASIAAARQIARTALFVRGTRGEAAETADWLLDQLERCEPARAA